MPGVSDNVLLKLVIQGMDPSEIRALAEQTGGQLNAQMKVHLDKLTQLHRDALGAQTKEATKAIGQQIDAEEGRLSAVKRIYDEQTREAKRAANAHTNIWRRAMEDLENITVAGFGVFNILEGGFERLKAFAEEVPRITSVYGSLTGSIDSMKEATDGQVTNIDLILARNRALEKDLHLTDAQFADVASQAKHFAEALGIPVAEALDKLVDGLATGRTKLLEHAGVVIDTTAAYRKFADVHGILEDKLTDTQKVMAIQEAALEELKRKHLSAVEGPLTLANALERVVTWLANLENGVAHFVGSIDLEKMAETAARAAGYLIPFGNLLADKVVDSIEATRAQRAAQLAANKAADAAVAQQRANLAAVSYDKAAGPEYDSAQVMNENASALKRAQEEAKKAAAELANARNEADKFFAKIFRSSAGSVQGGLGPAEDQHPLLTASGFETPKTESLTPSADEDEKLKQLLGIGTPSDKTLDKLVDDLQKEVIEPLTKKIADRTAELKDTSDKAGGGILARLLFGPDGPQQTYDEMNHFQQQVVDLVGMVSDSGKHMANAVGASLAATIAGDAAHAKSLRTITHDMLESLAAQALGRALFETASGVADLALAAFGDPNAGAAAGLHFAAAAAFGAVGGAAALGARAVGTSSSGSSTSAIGRNGSTDFGSGSKSNASDNSQTPPPPINLFVFPGGEAEAGRRVTDALNAFYQQSGRHAIQGVAQA